MTALSATEALRSGPTHDERLTSDGCFGVAPALGGDWLEGVRDAVTPDSYLDGKIEIGQIGGAGCHSRRSMCGDNA